MSAEQNKSTARQVMESLNQHDLDQVIKYYSEKAKFHGFAPMALDVNEYRKNISGLLTAFPDAQFSVDNVIAEGDSVVIQHTFRGTQKNAFQGVPASGKKAVAPAFITLHFMDGKVTEGWLNADFLGILQQIGAVPTPGQS